MRPSLREQELLIIEALSSMGSRRSMGSRHRWGPIWTYNVELFIRHPNYSFRRVAQMLGAMRRQGKVIRERSTGRYRCRSSVSWMLA